MLYANVLHAEARAYRFDNGRYFVSEPFWSEGKALEDDLLKLGFFRSRTYHGGTYAVWQKEREFIFVILVGAIAWTVEVTGLPNYLQFISENLGPALAHSDRLPDGQVAEFRDAKIDETSPRDEVASVPARSEEVTPVREEASCIAAIGVIDDGWRQCVHRNGTVRNVPAQSIALPGEPFQLYEPERRARR